CSKEFQGEAIHPVFVAKLGKLASFGRAGIVDQDVDLSESSERRSHKLRGGIRQPQVERDRDGTTAGLLDFPHGLIERALVAGAEDDLRAISSEAKGDGARPIPRLAPVTIAVLACIVFTLVCRLGARPLVKPDVPI